MGRGRGYAPNVTCVPLENLEQYERVVIVTDCSEYDYSRIVGESKLVVKQAMPPRVSIRRRLCVAEPGLRYRR